MYTNIISNPTWETIKQFMEDALRCTWPNISIIRSHCEVELMLDVSARSLAKQSQARATIVCDDAGEDLDGMPGLYAHAPLLPDSPYLPPAAPGASQDALAVLRHRSSVLEDQAGGLNPCSV